MSTATVTSSERATLRPLQVGDRVGLVATSSQCKAELVDASVELLTSWGLVPVLGEHVLAKHPRADYLAGTDEQRAADLTSAWTDDSLAAVFCARGGYGSVRMIDHLDAAVLRSARPKLLIGSSDVTGVHEFWEQRLGLPTWFGPMLATDELLSDEANIRMLHDALFSQVSGQVITAPDAVSLVRGEVTAPLTGGNMSLLAMTNGAKTQPAARAAGKIVLLEDVTESPYRLDGLVTSLIRSGYFDGAVGIALGTWNECGPPEEVRALMEELLVPLGLPLVWGLPFGHGPNVTTVPLGMTATLTADDSPRIAIV